MTRSKSVRQAKVVRSRLVDGRCVENTVKTATIPYTGDPAALIAAAARLRPRWVPAGLWLFIHDTPTLDVSFGQDARGVTFHVYVDLVTADVPALMAYLTRCGGELCGVLKCPYVADDDGTELPLPRISAAALAALPVASPGQH